MKIIINVAKRYSDLNMRLFNMGLIEDKRSPRDVKEYFIYELETNKKQLEFVTLHDELLNIIGGMIEDNQINHEDIIVNLYENGDLIKSCGYTPEGYLNDTFPLGVFNWDEW